MKNNLYTPIQKKKQCTIYQDNQLAYMQLIMKATNVIVYYNR